MSPSIRLVPLGGLGEIGMNCLAVECGGDVVVVDCGVMFPDRELGVDVIHPDFSWLLDRSELVRAVLITHGHEDHIGALPYLLRELPVPVYGPPYALALIEERLREHDLPESADLRPTTPRRPFDVGCFEVEPVRVTHSIADATALVLRTPGGTIVHTGDFKIDEDPTDGERFDSDRFREVGDEGVRLLLSDSTNSWVPGRSGPEAAVAETFDTLVGQSRQRVIVSIFASNVHRLRALFDVARKHGRKVCLLGRSVHRHADMATRLGYVPDASSLLVPADRAASIPRSQLMVVATGTQGEPPAAMARLAAGTHPALTVEPGDDALISARVIPGNEQSVYKLLNDLERLGANVRFRMSDPSIHVSGHAHSDEQRTVMELVRPRSFLPVHGTLMHLKRHARLAREVGIEDVLVVENGTLVEVDADGMRVTGETTVGRVHVDAGEEIPPAVLRDRALLAELGIAVVIVPVDADGELAGEPDVVTRGVVDEEEEVELLSDAREYIAECLAERPWRHRDPDENELVTHARRALKRYLGRRLGRKPLSYGVVVRTNR